MVKCKSLEGGQLDIEIHESEIGGKTWTHQRVSLMETHIDS